MTIAWVLAALALVATADAAETPSGLMIHVPLDGSVADIRGLGAVRAEAEGDPTFGGGVTGAAAVPGSGHHHVGKLHVSRLAWLMLRGRTPATGTIMLWVRVAPAPAAEDGDPVAPADTGRVPVVSSDAPLNLDVEIGRHPPEIRTAFDDDTGTRHQITTPIPSFDSWVHVALGWDATAGMVVVFGQGQPLTNDTGPEFRMPGLPRIFALGAPEMVIDDFRLYNRLLSSEELVTLPGLTAPPR